MEHLELYGRLRSRLPSRRFAFNDPGQVNFPNCEGSRAVEARNAHRHRAECQVFLPRVLRLTEVQPQAIQSGGEVLSIREVHGSTTGHVRLDPRRFGLV